MCSLEEKLDNKENHKIIVKELIDNLKGEVIEIVKMLDDYIEKNNNVSIISKLIILENNSIKKIEEIKNDQGDGLKKITNEAVVCYHETLLKIFRDKKEIYLKKALIDSALKLIQDKQNKLEDQPH
tara:strand:+ start:787 stop:1164 length:378 start_codon:yes stop_codon:yes gene_type:complete